MSRTIFSGLIYTLLFLFTTESFGADWPKFLGPSGDSKSSETDLRFNWADQPPRILWEIELGASYAAPVAHSNKVYVYHRIHDKELLECRDAASGNILWEVGYPTLYVDTYGYNGGPRGSPLVYSNRVYTIGVEGLISCHAANDGKRIWQRSINKELNVPQNFFGVAVSPVIYGDVLLYNAGAPDNTGIIGLDARTGKTLWTSSDHTASYSTPAIGTINGRAKAVFLTRQGLLCINPADGNITHSYPFRSRKHESVNAATPIIINNHVFLSASYNTGAVYLDMSQNPPREVWKDARVMQNHWATSIHANGFLYGVHGRHESEARIRCIKLKDGSLQWESEVGLGRASMIQAMDHFIILGERGVLALAQVSPDSYTEVFRKSYLHYPCWAPPILSNGRLFIRSETRMLCLDIQKEM